MEVMVTLDSVPLGKLHLNVDAARPEQVSVRVETKPEPGRRDELDEAAQACRNRRWLQIRYESGHTLSDGVLYSVRLRDVRFEGWEVA